MKSQLPAGLRHVPWITAEGGFDPAKFPIDSTLRQCVSSDVQEFRAGCRLLSTMVAHKRVEAGVFLLGLLRYFEGDLNALGVVVENLGEFRNARCAAALFAELRRVQSSNTTRRYLDAVITALVRFPADMVRESFWELSGDSACSPKMRAKFKAAAGGVPDSW
jgi:hypothetical protein